MKKTKRIAAIVGIVLLLSMYVISLISALMASEHSHAFFVASIFSTIIIPILLYGYILIYKLVHKDDEKDTDSKENK